MAGVLIVLIVGTAAGVGAPALGIWLWVRRGRRSRSVTSIRSHHHPGGAGSALFDALHDGPCGTADLAKEGANLVLDGRQTEQEERSIPDDISDLERLASAAALSAAEAVVPAVPFEIAIEADRDPDRQHGQAKAASAAVVSTELVTCGLDIAGDETRAAPREAAMPVFWPADVTDTELSADRGPASAEAPAAPAAVPPEIATCEVEYEAGTARPSEEAQPQKFARPDEILEAEACSEPARERDDTIETGETADGAECGVAESAPRAGQCAVTVAPPGVDLEPEPELAIADALPDSIAEDTAGEIANAGESARTRSRPAKPALHRDRRGKRRALAPQAVPASERPAPVEDLLCAPAEAKLRLMLHPIRRIAKVSAVLARPPGYPDRVTLLLGEGAEVSAYSEDRYDDVDLEWTADLLSGEVRLDCKEGYQWLRSSRRIHIFGEVAEEPGVISVGSAALSSPSTIICLLEDATAVRAAAEACGSTALVSHEYWSGIPDGWTVLSGYRPTRAAASGLATGLTGLDPGAGSEIRFSGGLRIRAGSFAQGSPPRIEIAPFPSGAIVTIDGRPAELGDAPWAVAQVCGAAVSGPGGEYVAAAHAMPSVVCLGLRRGAVVLRGRPDAPVAVGLIREPPAFLISASGLRRSQGRVEWLSPTAPSPSIRAIDPQWVAAVRSAASRRLPIEGGGSTAEDAWRRARERARRHRKPRT
jgi:hypothetical protein